jgi:hypothetical protein
LTFVTIHVLVLFVPAQLPPTSKSATDDPSPDRAAPCACCSGGARDGEAARADERAAMLRRLAATGMAMIDALHDEMRAIGAANAEAGASLRSVAELGLAYARVSRSVRQTLALEAKLETDAARRKDESSPMMSAQETAQAGASVRARLFRLLNRDDAGEDGSGGDESEDFEPGVDEHEACEHEAREWAERLDAAEPVAADRPAGEVVAGVCRALGLGHDPGLWTDTPPPDASPPRVAQPNGLFWTRGPHGPIPAPPIPPTSAPLRAPRPESLE